MTDHHAAVDAMVAALHPGFGSDPGVQTRDVVLVAGPWLAGSSSLAAALRTRLPDRVFVDAATLGEHDAPAAVIFVASAVAPLTGSDCALLDTAAVGTDLVIGAVSKIDVHRDWPVVLAADREAVAAHDPRYADMTWVGVAAAPRRSEPQLDELVDALELGLAHRQLARRNRLRLWQSRLRHAVRGYENGGLGSEARMTALRQERSEVVRRHRLAKSERTISLRSRIAQARVQLAYFARSRCASVRGELAEDAATLVRRRIPAFEEYVARRVDDVLAEVHEGVSEQLADLAAEFGLTVPADEPPPEPPPLTRPPLTGDHLETRLMMLLGAVLGVGVALTLSRLFADMARAYTVAGVASGGAAGLTVAVWVFGLRRTLRDRAVLDRWMADVVSELRPALEQHVTTSVLHAESALMTEQARRHDAESATAADRVGRIDDQLREHAAAAAAAAAGRERELPSLQRALEAVNRELNRSCE